MRTSSTYAAGAAAHAVCWDPFACLWFRAFCCAVRARAGYARRAFPARRLPPLATTFLYHLPRFIAHGLGSTAVWFAATPPRRVPRHGYLLPPCRVTAYVGPACRRRGFNAAFVHAGCYSLLVLRSPPQDRVLPDHIADADLPAGLLVYLLLCRFATLRGRLPGLPALAAMPCCLRYLCSCCCASHTYPLPPSRHLLAAGCIACLRNRFFPAGYASAPRC